MRIVNSNCGVISMYKYTLVRFLQSLCSFTLSSEIGRFFFFFDPEHVGFNIINKA